PAMSRSPVLAMSSPAPASVNWIATPSVEGSNVIVELSAPLAQSADPDTSSLLALMMASRREQRPFVLISSSLVCTTICPRAGGAEASTKSSAGRRRRTRGGVEEDITLTFGDERVSRENGR